MHAPNPIDPDPLDSDSSNRNSGSADSKSDEKINAKPTSPSIFSIAKDIVIASVVVFVLLLLGWALLS